MHVTRARIPVYGLVLCALAGCDRKTPPAPPTVDSGGAETITGGERLGWDQRAANAGDLAAVRFAIYVDGVRSELTGATCAAEPSATGFSCSAPVPRISAGAHALELASFVIDGSVLESARSAVLRVIVSSSTANVVAQLTANTAVAQVFRPAVCAGLKSCATPEWPVDTTISSADGVTLRLELVSSNVNQPNDLAFAPDGRVFVAEAGGAVRILPDAREVVVDGGELFALALDPQFERTHFAYIIYSGPAPFDSRSGRRGFSLARFRETSGTFGDRAILREDVQAAADGASAALRFGPDGKLYAAFDDGGEPALAADLSSPNGKVLRLNADGSTPDDQAGAVPLYSSAYHSPRGLDWQPSTGLLWVADRSALSAIDVLSWDPSWDPSRNPSWGPSLDPSWGPASAGPTPPHSLKRGITRRSVALPQGLDASAMAFYRGRITAFQNSLLIASNTGQSILRARFDPHDPSVIVHTERLLDHRVGGIRVVASAPDGSIYIATEHAIGRVVPAQ